MPSEESKGPWTAEETAAFDEALELYPSGPFLKFVISESRAVGRCRAIAHHIYKCTGKKRTWTQVQNRITRQQQELAKPPKPPKVKKCDERRKEAKAPGTPSDFISPSKGPWSDAEKVAFLEAMGLYSAGPFQKVTVAGSKAVSCCRAISHYIFTRTGVKRSAMQVRNRISRTLLSSRETLDEGSDSSARCSKGAGFRRDEPSWKPAERQREPLALRKGEWSREENSALKKALRLYPSGGPARVPGKGGVLVSRLQAIVQHISSRAKTVRTTSQVAKRIACIRRMGDRRLSRLMTHPIVRDEQPLSSPSSLLAGEDTDTELWSPEVLSSLREAVHLYPRGEQGALAKGASRFDLIARHISSTAQKQITSRQVSNFLFRNPRLNGSLNPLKL